MSSPSAAPSAPAAGASSASCWWKPLSSPDWRRPWRCCILLAGKASPGAFSGFLSGRILHSHQRSHPRVLCRARAALWHPLRSCPCIASFTTRFRAHASRPADWRCGCSCKASLERSRCRPSCADASSHGHRRNRHAQLPWAHADAAWLRSRKCHEARHHSTAHVTIQGERERIQSRQARVAYIEQIREKIASVPGVFSVAVAADATPPYAGTYAAGSFEIDGPGDREHPQAHVMLVDQRYFATLRISLLQGRIWNADENNRGDFIAVVNQAFATRYLSRPMQWAGSYAFPVLQLGIATRSPPRKAPPGVRSSA